MGRLNEVNEKKGNQLTEFKVGNDVVKLSANIVKQYLVNGNGTITDQEIIFFIHLCKSRKLNPFTKEVHLIKYGSQPATMVVSRDALEKRAIQHEKYNGKEAGIYVLNNETGELIKREGSIYIKSKEELVGAWCTVYRKDWEIPVTVEVNLDEYIGKKGDGTANSNWANKPVTMITKVAKAQALREAFIEELEGMYEAEETGINIENINSAPVEISNDNINNIPNAEIDPFEPDEANPFD